MPAPLASEALRAGPGRHPVHLTACSSKRMRATVRRCAWVPCLRPTARCAVGLHGMTLGEGEPALANVMPAPLAREALRAGPGRHPVRFAACSSKRMRATVRRCAWVPCLRPTARCAVDLHGMTLGGSRSPPPSFCFGAGRAPRCGAQRPWTS